LSGATRAIRCPPFRAAKITKSATTGSRPATNSSSARRIVPARVARSMVSALKGKSGLAIFHFFISGEMRFHSRCRFGDQDGRGAELKCRDPLSFLHASSAWLPGESAGSRSEESTIGQTDIADTPTGHQHQGTRAQRSRQAQNDALVQREHRE